MQNDNTLVSVVTAAYNCSKTIGETIESVLAQTWQNWEMLIVDDCSTDNSVEVIEKYASMDSRVKLIRLEKNSGSATARNTAIKNAKGKYVALLDSDDLWKPEKLSEQIKFMQEKDVALSFTSYEVFTSSQDVERRVFKAPKTVNYKRYLRNSIIGCLTVVVDMDKIPDFHMEAGYLEDVLTWMYYLRNGVVAYGIDKNLASYRVCKTSKSGKKMKNAKRFYQCLKQQPNVGLFRRLYSQFGYMFNASKKRLFSKKVRYNTEDEKANKINV